MYPCLKLSKIRNLFDSFVGNFCAAGLGKGKKRLLPDRRK